MSTGTITWPIPFIPTGMMQLKCRYLWLGIPGYQEFYADLFYFTAAIPAWIHFDPFFFGNLFTQFMKPMNDTICPFGIQNPAAQVFIKTSMTTLSGFFQPVQPAHLVSLPIALQIRPCWVKKTLLPGRPGIGRFYGPPCPADFLDENHFSSDGETAYASWTSLLTSNLVLGGVTWYPVHWSRSLSVIYPIEFWKLVSRPCVMAKSKWRYPYQRPMNRWVQNL